jgi:Rrf2 family transcriptional regulator, cysteine metabolism repressor
VFRKRRQTQVTICLTIHIHEKIIAAASGRSVCERNHVTLSLKCQYAIRGVLELARHYGRSAVPIREIAHIYGISTRFLEVILNELKQSGVVGSKRGVTGGFFLAVHPKDLTVGRIIRLIEGPLDPVQCVVGRDNRQCPQKSHCVLPSVWEKARVAVEQVYDSANFADLVSRARPAFVPDYRI